MENYKELAQAVDDAEGVLSVKMGDLRSIHGAGKLGVNVVANISDKLNNEGLSHYPDPLPVNQWEVARIYKRGTAVGDLLRAAFEVGEEGDEALRELARNDSHVILKQIKDLVGS
ncbi:hypothetical protein [Brevundimonas diminuta]|uniref:hypothetical protein n=1 Tax=Brevundimonas diminuta TaxID=293 RepID=UPI003D01300C